MARTKFMGQEYDTLNIPGKTLAEIGRIVLENVPGTISTKQIRQARSDVIDYESLKWLDDRINEVCDKGRI